MDPTQINSFFPSTSTTFFFFCICNYPQFPSLSLHDCTPAYIQMFVRCKITQHQRSKVGETKQEVNRIVFIINVTVDRAFDLFINRSAFKKCQTTTKKYFFRAHNDAFKCLVLSEQESKTCSDSIYSIYCNTKQQILTFEKPHPVQSTAFPPDSLRSLTLHLQYTKDFTQIESTLHSFVRHSNWR